MAAFKDQLDSPYLSGEGEISKNAETDPTAPKAPSIESTRSSSFEEIANMPGKSLYEKKCMIINQEIDAMGIGRYQWCIWTLCGFGYFLDLLWAQAFGLVLQPLQQELGFNASDSGDISTSFNAGLTAGAAFWGIMVDIIGRQWAFNFTVLFSSVFGLALAGSMNYTTFLVLTAFVGFGVGGNIPIDTTITLEFIPQRSRFLLPLLSVFQPIGVVITSALAYAFIPPYSCTPNFSQPNPLPPCNSGQRPCCTLEQNRGWRYLLLTVGAFTMAIFILRFIIFSFQESPKFLIYRGHDDKAVQVLEKVSKFNKRACGVTLSDFEALTDDRDSTTGSGRMLLGNGTRQLSLTTWEKVKLELSRYRAFFETRSLAILTILIWLVYLCDYWGFSVAGFYLPTIVEKKNSSLDLSLEFTYRSYVYIYLPGIAGVLLGVVLYDMPRVGRKLTMIISSALMAVSLFVFSAVTSEASNIGLNVMEYFFQSMFNAVLYGWTPEAFPAYIRGTAAGIASFWGRLFSIVGPQIAGHLLPPVQNPSVSDYDKILYLAGGVTLGCVVFLILLPNHTVKVESM